MSLQIDWVSLTPFITNKIQSIISSVDSGINPLIISPIKLKKLNLGDDPPTIAISRITSLHINEQVISAIFRYSGNAEIELLMDVSANSCGNTRKLKRTSRFMGSIYTSAPLKTRCRALVSKMDICVKIEIRHENMDSKKIIIRFEEPPSLSLRIHSNFSSLGPIWEMALGRIKKIIKDVYNELPEKIEIDCNAINNI